MTDDLEKYEALAKLLHSKRIAAMHYNQSGITSQVSVPDPDCATAADAITELVAMVREERIESDHYAKLAAVDLGANPVVTWQERAEEAERERDEARDLTWFWQIVDRNGLADVCSDERSALAELTRAHRELADYKDAARSEADRVNELTAELAELKRKMREPLTMTDELTQYEELGISTREKGYLHYGESIIKLVAMVREAREKASDDREWNIAAGLNLLARAEAAERRIDEQAAFIEELEKKRHAIDCELAELKRKMREPDKAIAEIMWKAFGDTRPFDASKPYATMEAAWLAAVNHMLGEKECRLKKS